MKGGHGYRLMAIAILCTLAGSIHLQESHHSPLSHYDQLSQPELNPQNGPVIGILSQQLSDHLIEDTSEEYTYTKSYIAGSYANYIKMSAARVVPVSAFRGKEYYDELLPKLNGVLIPGGKGYPDLKNNFTLNCQYIFEFAKQQNDRGIHYPLWGTCLGQELFVVLTQQQGKGLSLVQGQEYVTKSVRIRPQSHIFKYLSQDMRNQYATNEKLNVFLHSKALLVDTYLKNPKLNTFWQIQAETTLDNGKNFISAMRAKDYPFYSVQFHPQKAIFEWQVPYPHYVTSIRVAQLMSLMFVEETRRNHNRFKDGVEIMNRGIDNYPTTQTSIFDYIYLIDEPEPIDISKLTS